MAVVHEHTLRTSYTASQLQVACDGNLLTLPHGRTAIAVYSLHDLTSKVSLSYQVVNLTGAKLKDQE